MDSLPTCYKTVPHIRDNLKHRQFPSHPFSCVQAPFLDVLGTMEDPSLPLTLEDREEWGDPVRNPQHRLTISSYCPLYNITPQVCRRRKKGKKCRRFFFFFMHWLSLFSSLHTLKVSLSIEWRMHFGMCFFQVSLL